MCFAVIERYSICRCLYYRHPVDMCAGYGTSGHAVRDREELVGYACPEHSGYEDSTSKSLHEFKAKRAAAFTERQRLGEESKEELERDQGLGQALRGGPSKEGHESRALLLHAEEKSHSLRSHDKIILASSLTTLVTVGTVTKDIQSRDNTIDYVTALKYAKQVCEGQRPAKRLYAILANLKRGADIIGLLDEGVCDEDLPLSIETNAHAEINRGFKHQEEKLSSNNQETVILDVQVESIAESKGTEDDKFDGSEEVEQGSQITQLNDLEIFANDLPQKRNACINETSNDGDYSDIQPNNPTTTTLWTDLHLKDKLEPNASNEVIHAKRDLQANDSVYQEAGEKTIEGFDLHLLDGNETDSGCSSSESIWSARRSSPASISTVPAIEEASAELVSLLVEHTKLKDLYAPAITLHGPVEFRKALCAVFKSYAKALKTGAKKPQELKSGDLVRDCARRVAHACVAFHDTNVPLLDVASRWEALHKQRLFAEEMVENYLHNLAKRSLPHHDKERDLEDMSDESDVDEVEDPLPNLSKVVAYMTSGPPFEQLQKDVLGLSIQKVGSETTVLSLEEVSQTEKLDKKVDATIHSGNCSPSESVLKPNLFSLSAYKKRFSYWLDIGRKPKLVPGCTRLSWYCDCGARLFEDYATTDPEKLIRLAHLINRPTHATSCEDPAGSANPNLRTTSTSTISSSTTLSPQTDTHQPNESTHLCTAFNTACSLCNQRLPRRFLALCVNTGRFHKTLGEIDMTKITRDKETFRQIRSRYLEVRSFRARARRLFLLRPSTIHFVKINIEDTFRADIIENPSIPPHTEVHAKRYDYAPLDLPLPPITSNSFLHYMGNPECESLARTTRWSSCLPKKMDEQLLSQRRSWEPDRVVSGWAIHIDETLNEEALAILVLIILLLSAVVGVVYTVCTGDTSSGFAVAGYVATGMGVVITVLYFRWQHG